MVAKVSTSKIAIIDEKKEQLSVVITFPETLQGEPEVEFQGFWTGRYVERAKTFLSRAYRKHKRDEARKLILMEEEESGT